VEPCSSRRNFAPTERSFDPTGIDCSIVFTRRANNSERVPLPRSGTIRRLRSGTTVRWSPHRPTSVTRRGVCVVAMSASPGKLTVNCARCLELTGKRHEDPPCLAESAACLPYFQMYGRAGRTIAHHQPLLRRSHHVRYARGLAACSPYWKPDVRLARHFGRRTLILARRHHKGLS
jgi:hypothetical protein